MTAGCRCFSCCGLRQSGLAICNIGIDAAFLFLEKWTNSQLGFLVVFFFFLNVTASLCREEQILNHRDGVGLSELTAECTLLFGNCLWVSSVYLNVSKVGSLLVLPSVCMFKSVCWHQGFIWMTLAFHTHRFGHFNKRIADLLICGTGMRIWSEPVFPPVTHEFRSLFLLHLRTEPLQWKCSRLQYHSEVFCIR